MTRTFYAIACCLLLTATVTSAGYCQDLASLEKTLLFFPTKTLVGTPAKIGLNFDEISLQTADRVRLQAWWIPSKQPHATVVLSHGNGGNISHRLAKLKLLHDLGLNVLLYDYRGYGKSEGAPSELGLYADVQAAYDFLVREKNIPPSRIISYGESLGGAIAAHLASKNEVGALILDSSFTNLKDMAKTHYPLLAWLVQSNFDTLGDTNRVMAPVLVLHSPEDEVVPYVQGKKLFAAAKSAKQFVELHGDHNNGFLTSKKNYVTGLGSFLKAHFASTKP